MTIKDVKRSLNHKVKIKGYDTTFEFTACIFKLGQNGYYYTAELYDPRTNSMLICRLEEIEEAELCNRCVNRKDGVENGLE